MNSLIGIWLFTAIIYQGKEAPRPNPALQLNMIFLSESRNEIYYFRTNERGFCRRWADYRIEDNFIIQEVTEVDPENDVSCSNDSDMQMGTVSKTPYEIKDGRFFLHLSLGDEGIQYIFNRTLKMQLTHTNPH